MSDLCIFEGVWHHRGDHFEQQNDRQILNTLLVHWSTSLTYHTCLSTCPRRSRAPCCSHCNAGGRRLCKGLYHVTQYVHIPNWIKLERTGHHSEEQAENQEEVDRKYNVHVTDVRYTSASTSTRGVCCPCKRLPPMPERGFESRVGLSFTGFSMWHILKLVVGDFLRVLQFPPLLHGLMVSANV